MVFAYRHHSGKHSLMADAHPQAYIPLGATHWRAYIFEDVSRGTIYPLQHHKPL